jgi:hypothetical protein
MLLVILAIWFGYKKGKDSGRNPYLWAFICAAVFIGAQLLTGVLVGGIMGLGIALWGWPEDIYDKYSAIITVAAIIVSIGSLLLVFRYLDKVPTEEIVDRPPPPPTFTGA